MSRSRVRWLLLAVAGVILVVHSLAYNFVTDDAYISFVFSRNFAEHGQLNFNVGQPVEGYTNFLWTIVLGILMLVGINPELSSRVLSTACALWTLYLATRTMDKALGEESYWSLVPAFILACSSGFACWTSGGLETQLFTVLVTGALEATVDSVANPKALRRAGIYCALGAMTRPEGVLIFVLLGAARIVHRIATMRPSKRPDGPSDPAAAPAAPPPTGFPFKAELVAIAWFLGVWGPWFAWRLWYYGYWAPNTYYVKASGPWTDPKMAHEMIELGLYYVWVWAKQTKLLWVSPLVVVGFLGLLRPRTPRGVLSLACALVSGGYLAYVVTVGGDFMGLHRFIMPVFVTAAIAVVLGVEALARVLPRRFQILGAVPVALLGLGFAVSQIRLTRHSLDPKNTKADKGVIDTPAYLILYTDNRAAIGRAMAPCFHPDDFSIVGGAGAQPYFGRMRAVDAFGLVSTKIAHEEPRRRARAGHTKFAPPEVLATFDPTFVFSCYTISPQPPKGLMGCMGYWAGKGYEQVTINVPELKPEGDYTGTYYTFAAKQSRAFTCPNRVK